MQRLNPTNPLSIIINSATKLELPLLLSFLILPNLLNPLYTNPTSHTIAYRLLPMTVHSIIVFSLPEQNPPQRLNNHKFKRNSHPFAPSFSTFYRLSLTPYLSLSPYQLNEMLLHFILKKIVTF
ncbi:hypothetical protein I3843_Q051300 [Carya illinoinensis]|nr:hypothetical protein I3843_Q051300 [Carya illinoinensis]